MVGFAAACYVRGVDFIQIPTTLMAMVDSSVGGKTAVNSKSAKNMVGAFYQPVAVVADVGSLRTLPDRELASGVSEVIKYGLIRDAPFFEWLEDNIEKVLERDSEALIETVEASCRNKAEVVALDEKEGGVRATLNLGHTFGHAIETKAGYGTYLHGEAVGIGMHMAAKMSRDLGWISDELFERAVALVARAKVPIVLPLDSPLDVASFESIMAVDKKVADGLRGGKVEELAALEIPAPSYVPGLETLGSSPNQSDILDFDDKVWLKNRQDSRAYVQLVRCGAVDSAADFCKVVCEIAAQSPGNFLEHFWSATLYLLIWGKAKRLLPVFRRQLLAKP